jgi:ethanolamine utilization protein EutM
MEKVALGFIETRGDAGNIVAIDAMIKTANVELVKKVGIGAGYITAIIRGEVGAVKSAAEAGAEAAAKIGELICVNIIPSAHRDVFDLLGIKNEKKIEK